MFCVSNEIIKKVYEMFGTNEQMVNDDVDIIKSWIKTQPHLPETMEDVKIKNFLNLNKFSIEKTKEKIDMYYTIRSVIPDLFDNSNPKLDNIKRFFENAYVSTFPTLVDRIHRVSFYGQKKPNTLNATDLSSAWFALFEVRLYEDFMVDDIVIIDLSNHTLSDLVGVSPILLSKFFAIYKKVYALRVKNILFINSPSYVTVFLTVLKTVMPAKVFARIEVCQDYAVLFDVLPKEAIPRNYGGDGPLLDELNKMTQKKLSEYQARFDLLDTLRVNESLRPEKLDNDEILGYYGSFKKINVD